MPNNATATRPRTAPLAPRRVSGPTRRPVPVGAPARGHTGPFEKLARIPDHRLVDGLLRSRLCIWVIGILLGGIVFMQVSLLRMNSGISRAVAAQSTYERQNSMLQAQIAELSSGDRIRLAATKDNMIEPRAGDTRFLNSRERDVEYAARRVKPPSDRARAIMQNNGMLPGALAAPGTAGAATAAALGGVTGTATPVPTATALPTPAATPIPTPVATPPLPTPVPTVAVDPAVAPQG